MTLTSPRARHPGQAAVFIKARCAVGGGGSIACPDRRAHGRRVGWPPNACTPRHRYSNRSRSPGRVRAGRLGRLPAEEGAAAEPSGPRARASIETDTGRRQDDPKAATAAATCRHGGPRPPRMRRHTTGNEAVRRAGGHPAGEHGEKRRSRPPSRRAVPAACRARPPRDEHDPELGIRYARNPSSGVSQHLVLRRKKRGADKRAGADQWRGRALRSRQRRPRMHAPRSCPRTETIPR